MSRGVDESGALALKSRAGAVVLRSVRGRRRRRPPAAHSDGMRVAGLRMRPAEPRIVRGAVYGAAVRQSSTTNQRLMFPPPSRVSAALARVAPENIVATICGLPVIVSPNVPTDRFLVPAKADDARTFANAAAELRRMAPRAPKRTAPPREVTPPIRSPRCSAGRVQTSV